MERPVPRSAFLYSGDPPRSIRLAKFGSQREAAGGAFPHPFNLFEDMQMRGGLLFPTWLDGEESPPWWMPGEPLDERLGRSPKDEKEADDEDKDDEEESDDEEDDADDDLDDDEDL